MGFGGIYVLLPDSDVVMPCLMVCLAVRSSVNVRSEARSNLSVRKSHTNEDRCLAVPHLQSPTVKHKAEPLIIA